MDEILAALQRQLDSEGEGWTVTCYVTVVGCEQLESGHVVSQSFRYVAEDQAAWVTNGLLDEAEELRANNYEQ